MVILHPEVCEDENYLILFEHILNAFTQDFSDVYVPKSDSQTSLSFSTISVDSKVPRRSRYVAAQQIHLYPAKGSPSEGRVKSRFWNSFALYFSKFVYRCHI